MAIFISPIFDRTNADVRFAISKITEWITDKSLVRYDLKGCLNVDDLNRIEGNIEWLSEKLNQLYYLQEVDIKSWSRSDMPTKADSDRIIQNVNILLSAYYKPSHSPSVPTDILTYTNVNDIEEIINILRETIDLTESSFKKSGTFKSGSTMVLPIAR